MQEDDLSAPLYTVLRLVDGNHGSSAGGHDLRCILLHLPGPQHTSPPLRRSTMRAVDAAKIPLR